MQVIKMDFATIQKTTIAGLLNDKTILSITF